MNQNSNKIDVYLEIGAKRTFAGAIDWLGWCRSAGGAVAALQALLEYGLRYQQVLSAAGIPFHPPNDISSLSVIERLEGNATTDFGSPAMPSTSDRGALTQGDLERFQRLLRACWGAFDRGVEAATGKVLRLGPRGGGRDLQQIVRHVLGADAAYLGRLAWRYKPDENAELSDELERTRQATLEALAAAYRGELPERGPRGGLIWPPRYFVRRMAWHVLDHLWEIEDRIP
jgi:hypothetical protein